MWPCAASGKNGRLCGGEVKKMLGGKVDVMWRGQVKKMLEACGLDVEKVSITEDNIITVE